MLRNTLYLLNVTELQSSLVNSFDLKEKLNQTSKLNGLFKLLQGMIAP